MLSAAGLFGATPSGGPHFGVIYCNRRAATTGRPAISGATWYRCDRQSLRHRAFFAVTKLQKRNTPSLSMRFLVIAKPTRAMRETDGVIIAVQPSSGD
jgi:hypothetical protein